MSEYRRLEAGEIIQEGDEVDACRDGWRDDPVWVPAKCIGERAPDPRYPAHRTYRRPVGCTNCPANVTWRDKAYKEEDCILGGVGGLCRLMDGKGGEDEPNAVQIGNTIRNVQGRV